ncbi:hypothetical protein ACNRWW_19685 [Metabacillus sp. HB246100]
MEKQGKASERGNINRERKEYNALVIDLKKYREEKEVLLQEKVRKQEEKQSTFRFATTTERVALVEAHNIIKDGLL